MLPGGTPAARWLRSNKSRATAACCCCCCCSLYRSLRINDDKGLECNICSSRAAAAKFILSLSGSLNNPKSCTLATEISWAERYGSRNGSAQGPRCGPPLPYPEVPRSRARSRAELAEVVAMLMAMECGGNKPTDTGGGSTEGGGTPCGIWRGGASFPPTIITSSFDSNFTRGSNVLEPGLEPGRESGRPSAFMLEEGMAPKEGWLEPGAEGCDDGRSLGSGRSGDREPSRRGTLRS